MIAKPTEFRDLALPAFAAVARYGLTDADLICRLLEAMEHVACEADPADASRLRMLRTEIATTSFAAVELAWDRAIITDALGNIGPMTRGNVVSASSESDDPISGD